jgi:hypothetical protein
MRTSFRFPLELRTRPTRLGCSRKRTERAFVDRVWCCPRADGEESPRSSAENSPNSHEHAIAIH